ncbi:NAD(P)-dependent oxidoreductase [Candidatus Thorarchaeota archaeon]|nr:MAG: NAD(P)-dependent oxidoreductase [Candidatus Thorarchaeota archaeon]
MAKVKAVNHTQNNMIVLVTGAFGNIGESTLLALFDKEHKIRCFDLQTDANGKTAQQLKKRGDFEIVWGNILDKDLVKSSVHDVDCIIHLAAIIPPLSEDNPELARAVNIEGTHNIITAAEGLDIKPKFIFAGSVSTFGPTMHLDPPRTVGDPLVATDVYTETKIACEKIVKESRLPWTILRFTAAPPMKLKSDIDQMIFEIPLDQRIEFGHSMDVGQACANAVDADTVGKTLLIGGGKSAQMLQREFISKIMESMGIGMLPESAFRVAKKPEEYFYTDWLDTEESQQLLQYQKRTFDDYIEELKAQLGVKRYLAKLFKGQARKRILEISPYYEED